MADKKKTPIQANREALPLVYVDNGDGTFTPLFTIQGAAGATLAKTPIEIEREGRPLLYNDEGDGTFTPIIAIQGLAPDVDDALVFTAIADEAVSGRRVVTTNDLGELIYADNTILDHLERPLFLTTGAISAGASGEVLISGRVTEIGWAWTPGEAIYLSTNGQLTQTPPTAPAEFLREVARVIDPDTIIFEPAVLVRILA